MRVVTSYANGASRLKSQTAQYWRLADGHKSYFLHRTAIKKLLNCKYHGENNNKLAGQGFQVSNGQKHYRC